MSLDKIYNSEGYCDLLFVNGGPNYQYYRKDHLGNNREVWNANGNVTYQRTQYYPSGLPWAESTNTWVQNKKYNGKEFVEAHGLDEYDSSARWYYPAIMRTTTLDPLAEKYYSISPYAWCGNNPVNNIDPDGTFVVKTYTDDELKAMNLTRKDYDNLVIIINNLSKITDAKTIEGIHKITGLSIEQIKYDIQANQGPIIEITTDRNKLKDSYASADESGIYIHPNSIEYLGTLGSPDEYNENYVQNQVVGLGMTVFHEYGHYGDQKTNQGYNTGEWVETNGVKEYYEGYGMFSTKSRRYGKQDEHISPTGHRGKDVEERAFGIRSTCITSSGKIESSSTMKLNQALRTNIYNKINPF